MHDYLSISDSLNFTVKHLGGERGPPFSPFSLIVFLEIEPQVYIVEAAEV